MTSTTSAASTCAGDPVSHNQRVDVATAAGARSYLVAVPPAVDGRVLLIDLHGHGGSAQQIDANTGLSSAGTAAGFVVVTPDALGEPARWNFDRQAAQADDYAFMRSLIDEALHRYCVSSGRVVVIGTSNGAAFAGLYGCQDPRIVAIAMVIATTPALCGADRRIPSVLTIRGDADATVPYKGAQAWLKTWADLAGCSEKATSTQIWPGVERVSYPDCRDGQVIAIDTIAGGVHAWPGGTQQRPDNSKAGATYPATARVIEFLVQAITR